MNRDKIKGMGNLFKNFLGDVWRRQIPALALVSLAIFSVSLLAGYSAEVSESQKVLEEVMNMLGPLRGLSPLGLTAFIFLNNSLKSFLMILSGLVLGLGPLIFLTINGSVLGIVVKEITAQHGTAAAILSLLPHGMLELPSIIVSTALGFHLGIAVFQKVIGRNIQVKREIKLALLFFVSIILPALLAAALVEVFVTPLVIGGI